MPKKKKPSLKDDPYFFSKISLRNFFIEAVERKEFLWPDNAIRKLAALMGVAIEVNNLDIPTLRKEHPRVNVITTSRELHHHAVDLFYETYFGKRKGAPPISDEHLQYIVDLDAQGLSHGKIAKELGYSTSPPEELRKSSDRIRKQLLIAEKRGITPKSTVKSKSKSKP